MELTCLTRKKVYLNGRLLDIKKSQAIINHSPTGFSWGYGGSGPAQLALSVMLEMIGVDQREWKRTYQEFKWDVIAKLPQKSCALEMDFIAWLNGETDYRFEVRELDIKVIDDEEEEDGQCSMPEKCQRATWKQCDCACGGDNHGIQKRLFI